MIKNLLNWRMSTARSVSLFIALTLGPMSVVLLLLLLWQMENKINTGHQAHAEQQVQAIVHDLEIITELYISQAQDYVRWPILRQALGEPGVEADALADFFHQLYLFGRRYQQILVDQKGEVVYHRLPLRSDEFVLPSQLAPVLQGELASQVSIESSATHYQIVITVPVIGQDRVHGALVTKVPWYDFAQLVGLSKHLDGLHLALYWQDTLLANYGQTSAGDLRQVLWPSANVTIRYQKDPQAIRNVMANVLWKSLLVVLLLIVVIAMAAARLGRQCFVVPLEMLKYGSEAVAKGETTMIPMVKGMTAEMAQLTDRFNKMASLVFKREGQLKRAYQRLQDNQAQLLQSEKMASLGTLAAGVAHEINNPIAFVMSNLGTMQDYHSSLTRLLHNYENMTDAVAQEDPKLIEQTREELGVFLAEEDMQFVLEDVTALLQESSQGLSRVKEIVSGLKSFARVDEAEVTQANLNHCLDSTLNVIWNELKYNCVVEKDYADLPLLGCYPGKLNQVSMNILVNAKQAVEKDGKIKICTRATDEAITVKITDNGCGISQENIEKLFNPFFTTKPVGVGTGLGLSISFGIVKTHQGSLNVESELGKGTSFIITLPLDNGLGEMGSSTAQLQVANA